MFLKIRNTLNKIIPTQIKYKIVRNLPKVELFCSSNFRGIDKPWDADEKFIKLYKEISEKSLLDIRKAYTLFLMAKHATSIDGVYAEMGVFNGAGSKLMLEASSKNKDILLFDTFEGLPKIQNNYDKHWKEGDLNEVNYEQLKSFLCEPNFKFYKGYFPDSAKDIELDIKFAFVHLDFDLYVSTLDALKYCYTKMSKNGIILIDDYGTIACIGVRKAVEEFFSDKQECVIPNFNGQCIIVKQ